MTTPDRPLRLRVRTLREGAAAPRYQSEGAAGLDLTACLDEPVALAPLERALVPTGIAIALPRGHEGSVRPRSGLALRHGLTVLNSPGTIDEDYRGEVKVLLINLGAETFTVTPGERIAQLVVSPVARVTVEPVPGADALGDTARGAGGFGSTGR